VSRAKEISPELVARVLGLVSSVIELVASLLDVLDRAGVIDRRALAYALMGYVDLGPRRRYDYTELAYHLARGSPVIVYGSRRRVKHMARRLSELTGYGVLFTEIHTARGRAFLLYISK